MKQTTAPSDDLYGEKVVIHHELNARDKVLWLPRLGSVGSLSFKGSTCHLPMRLPYICAKILSYPTPRPRGSRVHYSRVDGHTGTDS